MLEILQYISIFIEAVVAIIGILMVIKGKKYGYGLFITFLIYVFYDLTMQLKWNVNSDVLVILFFIASISILLFAWSSLKEYFTNQSNKNKRNKK